MRLMMAALAAFALVLGACETDDAGASPAGSPLGTVDLLPSPDETVTTDASPTESPEETGSPEETATGSPEEESPGATAEDDETGATASPAETDDGAVGTAGTCEDAFTEVPDLTRMDSLSDLGEAFEALDATIEACESVDEWTEQAEDQLGFANLDLDTEEFLQSRCEASEELSETELCDEVR